MKTISVIIPTYNRERYVKAAIDSVLNQKLPKDWSLEVIVADDGSTDKTAEIIKAYGNRITFLSIPHSGKPAVVRNAALRKAKGELIAFQDSDDLWASGKLVEQMPVFDNPSVVMSFGNAEIMKSDGTLTGKPVVDNPELHDGEKFETLLKHNVVSTLTVVVRLSALKAVGFFNESDALLAVEDYELWLRIAARFTKGLKPVPRILAHYRVHDQNISTTDDLQAVSRILNVYNSVWQTKLSLSQRNHLEAELQTMHEIWGKLHDELYPEQKPVLSVVMSVYNAGIYLKPSVESILSQTFKNFEFIVIDDGSSDSSVETIKSFGDPRIRLVRQANHGLVYSLNKGVSLSRGKYIARQDADDVSLPGRLEKELKLITTNEKIGMVGSFFTYIDLGGNPSKTMVSPTLHDDLRLMLLNVNPFGHGTVLFRKEALESVGSYNDDYHAAEDYNLWRHLATDWEFAIIPESLYWYRINPESISHSKQSHQHSSRDKVVEELWQAAIPALSPSVIRKHYHYYKALGSPFSGQISQNYLDNLFGIALGALTRRKPRTFLRTALGVFLVSPRRGYRLFYLLCVKIIKHVLIAIKLRHP